MIRVISSPSSSTIGFSTLIFSGTARRCYRRRPSSRSTTTASERTRCAARVLGDDDQHRRLDHRAEQDDRRSSQDRGQAVLPPRSRRTPPPRATPTPSSAAGLAPSLPAEDGAALAEADAAQLFVALGRPQVSPGEEEQDASKGVAEAGASAADPLDHPPLAGHEDGLEEVELGREMVIQGPAAHAGALEDLRGRDPVVVALDEQLRAPPPGSPLEPLRWGARRPRPDFAFHGNAHILPTSSL